MKLISFNKNKLKDFILNKINKTANKGRLSAFCLTNNSEKYFEDIFELCCKSKSSFIYDYNFEFFNEKTNKIKIYFTERNYKHSNVGNYYLNIDYFNEK